MIEYQYVAKTKDGVVQKGAIEAENEAAAAKVLVGRELYPVNIFLKQKSSIPFFNKVSVKDKAFLMRQLATTINAGLPISQALQTLREQISNKKLGDTVEQISRDVESGMPLSTSFSRFPDLFSQIDVTLTASGETSGTLDKVLIRMADGLENEYRMKKKIQSAFYYPGFILAVVIGVIIVMTVFVMPQMEGLYKSFGADLPILTRIVLGMSHGVTRYGIVLLIILFAIAYLLRTYINTNNGRKVWDSFLLKIPIVGQFLQKVYLARFSRTLSGLVGSGVSLLDSLNITSKAIGNKVYEEIIVASAEKVKSGIPLSTPMKENSEFPPIMHQMIRVGEQTGELDNMLTKLAEYFEDEVDTFVKNMTSIIEPVIIVVMAVLVGFILVAVMMPVYSIGKVIH